MLAYCYAVVKQKSQIWKVNISWKEYFYKLALLSRKFLGWKEPNLKFEKKNLSTSVPTSFLSNIIYFIICRFSVL